MEDYISNKTNLRFVRLSVRKLRVHIELFWLSLPPLPFSFTDVSWCSCRASLAYLTSIIQCYDQWIPLKLYWIPQIHRIKGLFQSIKNKILQHHDYGMKEAVDELFQHTYDQNLRLHALLLYSLCLKVKPELIFMKKKYQRAFHINQNWNPSTCMISFKETVDELFQHF